MAKMLITKEQYSSLTPIGKELHDYWMNYKPKMYKELAQMGSLWSLIEQQDKELDDMILQLIPQLGIAGAMEVARAEIYETMD